MIPAALAVILAASLAVGCSRSSSEGGPPPASSQTTASLPAPTTHASGPAQASSSALPEADPEDVLPEDFEDRAKAEITPQNLDQKLDALEKEIGQDG